MRATALLAAAEDLTQTLQSAAGRRTLHIVNLCGRQRMRVQRIAKDQLLALLDTPLGMEAPTVAAALLDEFERALRELEDAPLSSPTIRTALAQVRDDWLRLVAGLRTRDAHAAARAMAQASETLLVRLDVLTQAYENSLQVIMG